MAFEFLLHQRVGCFADVDFAGLGVLLHTRGRVHGVALNILGVFFDADNASHHRAARTDAKADLKLAGLLPHVGVDLQGRPHT